MARSTPWNALLARALGLGVQPGAFWRLSIKEWRAIAAPSAESLSRAAFDALVRQFPDNRQ
ncbi:MAG: phage tail assembly chaperone [Caulobacterales bacterium]|jgi:uncharacterized phage protein (TIGR02216 family)|nr:phage tail assembly chaperone [Caulobacterales bacterium]